MRLVPATAGNGVVISKAFDSNSGFPALIQVGPPGSPTMKTVAYDDLGNIVTKSDVGTYSYPALGASSVRPHAVSSIVPSGTGTVNTSFVYDANGNMLTGNGRTTSWTAANMVASITQGTTTVTFDYDSEHSRSRQVTNSGTTLYINDPGSGLKVEKFTGTSGNVRWNEYLFAGGQMIGEHFTYISGTTSTTATRYFVTDHLGSIAVITDETGAVVERLSYDAWGKRRFPTGADDPAGSITSQTTRGFTGHEMIDEVGLVNMNGRIYDPQLGRFMSADPFVSDPTNGQDLNRYAYVHNNPLSYTDPTGYFSLGSLFKMIVAVVIAVVFLQPEVIGAFATALESETLGAIASGAIGGAIAGGITGGGDLRSILVGAVSGGAFAGLGNVSFATFAQKVVAYGMTGGVTSVMGGGNFQSGFLAAGFGALAGPEIEGLEDAGHHMTVASVAGAAVAGGVGSVLGGGKFENGAVTGAFAYAAGKALTPAAQTQADGNGASKFRDGAIADKGLGLHVDDGILKGTVRVNCGLSTTNCSSIIARLNKLNGNGIDITYESVKSGGDVYVVVDPNLARNGFAGEYRPIEFAGRREIALLSESLAGDVMVTHEGGHMLGLGHQPDATQSVMMRSTNFMSLDHLRPVESQWLKDAYRN